MNSLTNSTHRPPVQLDRTQTRRVDQVAIREFGFSSLMLMENAANGAARCLAGRYQPTDGGILIVCGGGNNGGDGLAMARHLYNAGLPVVVLLVADRGRLTQECELNWQILRHTSVPAFTLLPNPEPTSFLPASERVIEEIQAKCGPIGWVVDAVLGTGVRGELRPPLGYLMQRLNQMRNVKRFAMDLPSGWDCDEGPMDPNVFRADITYTLVAPKISFQHKHAPTCLGEVVVGDIGAPPEVLERVLEGPLGH